MKGWIIMAGPIVRAVKNVGLRPLACWECRLESRRRHGCLSVVSWVLSGRDLCEELIIHPEESYRLWCIVVCDVETSWMRRPWPTGGCRAKKKESKLPTLVWRSAVNLKRSQMSLRKFLNMGYFLVRLPNFSFLKTGPHNGIGLQIIM